MQREMRSKNCNLAGTSDLTIVAPIEPGLVPTLDTITYKTRVKTVLRALHSGRTLSHEADMTRLLADAVERVGRIHSVRIVVIEPEDLVMLAATFDGSWEAYVRVVWQKTARLLDLVFCNTQQYTTGGISTFEQWAEWLYRRQAESPFLYAPPGLTYDDVQYQRMHERLELRHGGADAELRIAKARIAPAEEVTSSLARTGVDPMNGGHAKPLLSLDAEAPAFRQGVRALAGLYRLAPWYPPGTADGGILLRAAHELLPEFARMVERDDPAIGVANLRFKDALDWFRDGLEAEKPNRKFRQVRKPNPDLRLHDEHTIQAGILEPHPESDHGVVMLVAFTTGSSMASFLDRCNPTTRGAVPKDDIAVNLALTLRGLQRAGLSEAEIRCLPEAFVQGMPRRAGLLGDARVNHPSRWRLPVANWQENVDKIAPQGNKKKPRAAAAAAASDGAAAPNGGAAPKTIVELDTVHAFVQLRLCKPGVDKDGAHRTLMAKLQALVADDPDVKPLALQWMLRLRDSKARSPGQTIEHFGFGEGHSDPVFAYRRADGVAPEAGRHFDNLAHVGDALVGYGNAADEDPPWPWPEPATQQDIAGPDTDEDNRQDDATRDPVVSTRRLLANGSFLVVRKLEQDVRALEAAVGASGLDRDLVLSKMMGRWPARHPYASRPLVRQSDPAKLNDFHYRGDAEGIGCPFHAHIRRANPRDSVVGDLAEPLLAGGRVPTLVRRGMSYGAPHDRDTRDPAAIEASLDQDRGLMFMAYNANISEQFEVIQRWLVGGNSSGSVSTPSDPFLGFAEPGRPRFFRFMQDNGRVERVRLDGSDTLHDEPRPFVRLEWGMYAFAPSTRAIAMLVQRAKASDAAHAEPMPWSAERGRGEVERLSRIAGEDAAIEAWKVALEDTEALNDFTAASIWAHVREHHGGVLRTPYGVLVGKRELVDHVLAGGNATVTIDGYMEPMKKSFGPIFLGRDAGKDYAREAQPAMKLIAGWDVNDTYVHARQATIGVLDALVKVEVTVQTRREVMRRAIGEAPNDVLPWEMTIDHRELIDELLAQFCEMWLGLSTHGGHFARGGLPWTWQEGQPPRYPGHFMAPSRWFFQPHPSNAAADLGAKHGQALEAAMNKFLRDAGAKLPASVQEHILNSDAARADEKYAARTIIGVIMGFVPTIDGVLRRVLAQWWSDGTLSSLRALRALHRGRPGGENIIGRAVDNAFTRSMQLRPVPELIWRTAREASRIGEGEHAVNLEKGEKIVLGLSSATHESLSARSADLTHAFGGDRAGPHAPTHGCPGRELAMALMKGFVQGLVDSEQPLRPGPIPTSFNISGQLPPALVADALRDKVVTTRAVQAALAKKRKFPPAKPAPVKFEVPADLWAVGDSWLDDILRGYPDLITALRPLGYDVTNEALDHTHSGLRLEQLAADAFLAKLRRDVADAADGIGGTALPKAILLCGGGNDLVQPKDRPHKTPLYGMLRPGAKDAIAAINQPALDAYLKRMRGHHDRVLDVLTGTTLPILIHAYDYPIPDGRDPAGTGGWLKPIFEACGIHPDTAKAVMRVLIDGLNKMVADLVADRPAQHNVHHLALAGTLEKAPDFAVGHEIYWGDELHPTPEGYHVIAKAIAQGLADRGVAPVKKP